MKLKMIMMSSRLQVFINYVFAFAVFKCVVAFSTVRNRTFLPNSSTRMHNYPNRRASFQSTIMLNESSNDYDKFTINIALTREEGKNDALRAAIEKHPTKTLLSSSIDMNIIEMPSIQHADGPDIQDFVALMKDPSAYSQYDYIVITSPESAKVFAESISSTSISNDLPKIAAVGKATEKMLTKLGFQVSFVPSNATGETLAQELPPIHADTLNRVLYPSSAQAATTIQEMLETQREDASFQVTRMNTYDTIPVIYTDSEMDTLMDTVQIACFGSPSAVKSWLGNVDRILGITDLSEEEKKTVPGCNGYVYAACIGKTTAQECLKSGRWDSNSIYYPATNPGIEGWTEACMMAVGDAMEEQFFDY